MYKIQPFCKEVAHVQIKVRVDLLRQTSCWSVGLVSHCLNSITPDNEASHFYINLPYLAASAAPVGKGPFCIPFLDLSLSFPYFSPGTRMFNQPITPSQHQLLTGCAFALSAFLEPGAKLKAPLSQKVDETRLNPTSCSRLMGNLCIAMLISTVRTSSGTNHPT